MLAEEGMPTYLLYCMHTQNFPRSTYAELIHGAINLPRKAVAYGYGVGVCRQGFTRQDPHNSNNNNRNETFSKSGPEAPR